MSDPKMSDLDAMLHEFNQEAATTKRVLGRVPADKLGWKPHDRSMSLGQLALHIATVPGGICRVTEADAFDVSQANFTPPEPKTMDEVHAALDASIQKVECTLTDCSEGNAEASWHLMLGDKELASMPRMQVWRSLMLNHWYHHRGQLSVYLRLLDVPLPSIYGPSADENPFS